ncbi:transposase [Cryobacterium sp. SO2]|uniref:transposase n=1 Tax=Cryobacterium sp. SO2 TaxID=1897060 RepID=UPI00223CDB63|nr:transposase [Cryobacterium sp. SO2]WEO76579.1 transposase [Cryobacterium sp. SO2]
MVVTLAAVARDLYGLDPAEFTAARNTRARELKPSDPALAAQVAALHKPSPAAWAVNLVARERTGGLEALLLLGERMRTAQEQFDRAALGQLGTERRAAVAALARAGGDLAADRGHPLTAPVLGEVEQTLQAGTSDPAAAAAVSSGLLVRALRAVGFEPVDLDGAVAVPGAAPAAAPPSHAGAAEPPSPVHLAAVRRRKEAAQEAEVREREAEAATAELEALDRRAQRLRPRRTSLEAEVADLRDQLGTAEQALAAVHDEDGALADARTRAQRNVEETGRQAREARRDADALTTPR